MSRLSLRQRTWPWAWGLSGVSAVLMVFFSSPGKAQGKPRPGTVRSRSEAFRQRRSGLSGKSGRGDAAVKENIPNPPLVPQ